MCRKRLEWVRRLGIIISKEGIPYAIVERVIQASNKADVSAKFQCIY